MVRRCINGQIIRIVSYKDGTSQVDIIRTDGGNSAQSSSPFYGPVPDSYLSRVVDFTEEDHSEGQLVQTISSADDSLKTLATNDQIARIRQHGRVRIFTCVQKD